MLPGSFNTAKYNLHIQQRPSGGGGGCVRPRRSPFCPLESQPPLPSLTYVHSHVRWEDLC